MFEAIARKLMSSKKKIPAFKSDRAAAAFVDRADLSQYDLSGAQLVSFEIKRDTRVQSDLAAGRLDSAIQRALDDEKNGRTKPL
jgi:hypothetical protein